MGKNTGASDKGKEKVEHDEQDGVSVHSPCKPAPSALDHKVPFCFLN